MDDNKDIEKVSKTVFDKYTMEPPEGAWNKLDAELDKKQAALYKRSANRFKRLSLLLLFIMVSFLTWHYYTPAPSAENQVAHSAGQVPVTAEPAGAAIKSIKNISEPVAPAKNSTNKAVADQQTEQQKSQQLHYQKSDHLAKSGANTKTKAEQPATSSTSNGSIAVHDAGAIQQQNEYNNQGTTYTVDNGNPRYNTYSNLEASLVVTLNATDKYESIKIPDSIRLHDLQHENPIYPELNSMPAKFSIAAFYAPNYYWNHLSDNTNNDFDDVAMYNSREKTDFSYTAGITLHYALNSNWGLVSGISYSTLNLSSSLNTMYAGVDANYEMHYQYPTSSGIIDMPHDAGYPPVNPGDSIKAKTACKQSIGYINTPLMIRYTFTNNNFVYYVNTGFNVNFKVSEGADVNMENNGNQHVDQINGLKNIYYGFQIGAGIQYRINHNSGIFAEPTLRGALSPINKNMAVDSYPYIFGVQLGFTRNF